LIHVREILLTLTSFTDLLVHLSSELAERELNTRSGVKSDVEILEHKINLETTVIIVDGRSGGGKHSLIAGIVHLRGPAATSGSVDDLSKSLGVSTKSDTKVEAFRDSRHGDTENEVVHDLGDETSRVGAAVDNLGTHALKNRLSLLESLLFSTAHEGKGTLLSTGNATGHRSINKVSAQLLGLLGQLEGSARLNGGRINNEHRRLASRLASLEDRENTILASKSVTDDLTVGEHGDQDVHLLGNSSRRSGTNNSATLRLRELLNFSDRSINNIENNEVMTLLHEVVGHVLTHSTKTKETNGRGSRCGEEATLSNSNLGVDDLAEHLSRGRGRNAAESDFLSCPMSSGYPDV